MRTLFIGLLLGGISLFAVRPAALTADDFKPESGFTLLFNGTDLSGWKMKTGESLEGKTESPTKRFTIADGVLLIDPKVKGDLVMNTVKEFAKDVHIKFEFLPGKGCNNDLFFRGTKFDLKTGDVKNLKEGEWNQFEIIVRGAKAEFKNNGETQKTLAAKTASSVLGIRAEFGPMQIRRLRFQESP